ncbi:MAG: ParA family protein [Acidiferrobacterales bacterium]|nr:ParA family protein [Acidiferrobacterales bacterium]
MNVMTVCSTKGGVGKTSLCANLGGFVAESGWKVLLIDTDPQPSLSTYFPLTVQSDYGITRIFSHVDINNSISKTSVSRLDIVRSDDPDNKCDREIKKQPDGRNRMRNVLLELNSYDLVIIDTQGASSAVLDSAILSSDLLLSPIVPDMLSAREFFRGIVPILGRLRKSYGAINLPLSMHALIYRTRPTVDARQLARQIRYLIGELPQVNLLNTSIPDRTVYRDAASAQVPVHRFETKRRFGTSANESMTSLATELLPDFSVESDRMHSVARAM